MRKHGGEINDCILRWPRFPSFTFPTTHYYTKEGTQVITDQVLTHIKATLDIHGKPLKYDPLLTKKNDVVGL